MNAKQITAVLAVVAILAAGVVGLGYAYTATTENADNVSDIAYLKVEDGATTGAYTAHFTAQALDSLTDSDGTKYKLQSEVVDVTPGSTATEKNLQLLGTMTLVITPEDLLDGDNQFSLTLAPSKDLSTIETTGLDQTTPLYVKASVDNTASTVVFTEWDGKAPTSTITPLTVLENVAFKMTNDAPAVTTVTLSIYGQVASTDYTVTSAPTPIMIDGDSDNGVKFTFVVTPSKSA